MPAADMWREIGGRVLRHPAPFLLLALFVIPPPGSDNKSLLGLPDLCPFKVLTHFPCPGCGMTRSLVCLAHGQLERSVLLHPLGPVFFFLLLGTLAVRAFPKLQPTKRALNTGAALLIVALLTLWIVRLTGWLPKPP